MRWLVLLGLLFWSAPAAAVTCTDVSYLGKSYTICEVDPAQDKLRLFRAAPDGEPYGNFLRFEAATGEKLSFAMNAGMFHDDLSAVGHYLEAGREEMRLVTNAGPGNFGLLPNGVLCVGDDTAKVYETLAFESAAPDCRDATQSGPMLVIDGALHPRFLVNATTRYIRNGVGTSGNGDLAVFAISNQPVSFHEFGSFFRDYLKLPNALYLDGKVSRLHAPALGRSDFGWSLGPMIGVIE